MSQKLQGSGANKRIRLLTATLFYVVLGAALAFGPMAGQAQAINWITDGNGNWSAAANWNGGVYPNATGAVADFTNDITADRTVTLDAALSTYVVGALNFSDATPGTAGSWILARAGTDTLTLDNGGPSPIITVGALGTGKTVNISAVVTGTAGLTKAGTGTLILSGANTWSGAVIIADGTLTMSGANAYGSVNTTLQAPATLNINNAQALGTSTLVINGGIIDNTTGAAITLSNANPETWNNDFTFTGTRDLNTGIGAVTLTGTRQVTVNAGTLTVGGVISGAAGYGLTKAGNGTLILGSTTPTTNTYSGATTINMGVLEFYNTFAVPNWGGALNATVAPAATLAVNANVWQEADITTLRGAGGITWNAGSFLGLDTTTGDATITASMADANKGINKLGAYTLTLTGVNTYAGGTKITSGVLVIPTTVSLPSMGIGTVPATGATLAVPLLAAPGPTDWSNANLASLQANVSWAPGSYLGLDTTLSPGYTYDNANITANMGINKLGTTTMILTGTNTTTFTGGTLVTAGTLQMGSATALGASTNNLGVIGTLDIASYSPTVGSLSGSGTTGIITSTVAGTHTLTVNTSSTAAAYGGIITNGTGTLSLIKDGTGTLTISNTGSTYTGGTILKSGTILLGYNISYEASSGLGANTSPIYFQGGTLASSEASGNTLTFMNPMVVDPGYSGTILNPNRSTWTGAVTGGNSTTPGGTINYVVNTNTSRNDFNNNWTNFYGTLVITGSGTSRAMINSGTFVAGAAGGWLNATMSLDGATLAPNTNSNANPAAQVNIGALTSTGNTGVLGSGTAGGPARYWIGQLNTNTTFAGSITGDNATITKVGTGTLILTGNNTYRSTNSFVTVSTTITSGTLQIGNGGPTGSLGTNGPYGGVVNNATLTFNRSGSLVVANNISGLGTTIINAGTIYLNGSVANPITVGATGVLGGTGTVSLPVTIQNGGGMEVGQTGAGNSRTVNSLTYNNGGFANFSPSFGTISSPLLTVTNGVTTNNLGTGSVKVNILGLPIPNGTYDLIKYGTTMTNFLDFSMGTDPGAGPRGPKYYNLANDPGNNQINLIVTGAVGEITWTGAATGQSWDQTIRLPGTTDWKYTTGGAATDFYTSDNVTFDGTGSLTVNISSGDVSPSMVTFNNPVSNNYTINGTNGIGNGATILKEGSGKVTISNNNSYNGGTTITGGTISIAADGAAGAAAPLGIVPSSVSPKNINLNGGALSASATMVLNANRGIVLGPVSGTGTGYIDVATDGTTLTYAGVIANNYDNNGNSISGLTKTGSGNLLLNGANIYTGDTVVGLGTLTLGVANALQYSTLNYDNQGGFLSFGGLTSATFGGIKGTQPLTLTNTTFGGVALTVGNADVSSSYAGGLSGLSASSLNKIGTGTLTLTGANTYGGSTFVTRGELVIAGNGSLTTSLNTNAALLLGADYIFGNITFSGDATASLSSVSTGQNLRGGGNFTIQDTANVTINQTFDLNNEIAGSGQASNNIVSLNGGTLTVSGGFIKTRTDANKLATINFNGGTLTGNYGGSLIPANSTTFSGLTCNVQANGAKIDDTGSWVRIDQPLLHDAALATVDGGLDKIGVGTLFLTGNNTYTGTTTVEGGTLQVGYATASGLLGTGAVDLKNGSILVLNRTDRFTMPNAIGNSVGVGTLQQTGAGSTALLTSPNTYTGATTVTAGTLLLTGTQSTSGVTVSFGAGFGAGPGGATVQALSFDDSANLVPTDGTNLTTTTVSTDGGLVNNGTTNIAIGNIGPQAYSVGSSYTLLNYQSSTGPVAGFNLNSYTLPIRIKGTLADNAGTFPSRSIVLTVSKNRYPVWSGANGGIWDVGVLDTSASPTYGDVVAGTQSWREYGNIAAPTVYYEPSPGPAADFVYFDDSAAVTTTVNISTTVSPALVTMNNTRTYTFGGTGIISGPTALIKSGTGLLIVSNGDNNYTGGTTINAGTIQLGNGGSTGSIAGNITNNGAIVINRNDTALILSGIISGTGTVTQTGPGTTTFSGANTYTGDTVISNGSVILGTATTLQTSTLELDTASGTLSFGTLTAYTLGGLAGTQGIALTNTTPANVTLTVGGDNANTSYSGALTGGGASDQKRHRHHDPVRGKRLHRHYIRQPWKYRCVGLGRTKHRQLDLHRAHRLQLNRRKCHF